MADQPTELMTFSASGFSDIILNQVANYLSKKTGPIIATDPEAQLVANTVARGGNQEELLRKLTSLSDAFHTEEGTKRVLEGLGVNEVTLKDKDFRIILCKSPAGPVCFQGRETKDGLELNKSLPLAIPARTGIVETLLQSMDNSFKPVPQKDGKPILIPNSEIDQRTVETTDGVLRSGNVVENLTPQGATNITPVIQMIRLADKALDSKTPTEKTNASLPNVKQPEPQQKRSQ